MPNFRPFFTAPQLPVDLFRCESDPSMTLKTNSGEFWCSRRSKKCLKNNIGIFIYRFLFHRIAIIDCFGKICQSFLSMETFFFCCFGKSWKGNKVFQSSSSIIKGRAQLTHNRERSRVWFWLPPIIFLLSFPHLFRVVKDVNWKVPGA